MIEIMCYGVAKKNGSFVTSCPYVYAYLISTDIAVKLEVKL